MKVKVLNAQTQIEVRLLDLQDFLTRSSECLMGRSPSSGLILESSDVSRLHGKLVLEQGQYYFYDLGSANGSLVNGAIAQANHGYLLRSGDIIRIGEYVLTMEAFNNLEDLPATVIGDPNATIVDGHAFGMMVPGVAATEASIPAPIELAEVESLNWVTDEMTAESDGALEAGAAIEDEGFDDEIADEAVEKVTIDEFDEIVDAIADEVIEDESVDEAIADEVIEDVTAITDEVVEDDEIISDEVFEELEENEIIVNEVSEAVEDESDKGFQEISSSDLSAVQPELFDPSEVIETVLDRDPWSDPSVVPEATSDTLPGSPEPLILESESTVIPTVDSNISSGAEVVPSDRTMIQPTDLIDLDLADDSPENATVIQLTDLVEPLKPSHSGLLDIIKEKYIVLLAHDNQEAELIQLIESYQPFLSQCQTLTTPTLRDTLKQQIGFTVTQQTPALLQGGYQSVNSLITGGKIIAVLFARDFLTPQSTQSNDDALSRSCNVHGVLFASNLPTAEAIVHSLQTKVSSAQ
jgi:methylglyoxal synthase